MIIEEIFEKRITREIDGVIKANDFKQIDLEVDEYVVTKEIEDKLETFFDIYASTIGKPSKDIGVWISGFFGSGKSHLLKILSVILADQEKYRDRFLDKLKSCDTFLQGNAKKALSTPTETILFNIDQQSNIMQGNSSSSVLSVFQRVFDEMRGYFGEKPYIAELEKFLEEEGLYQKFKIEYEKEAGDTWENKRHQVLIKRKEFAKALSSVLDISEDEAKGKLKEFQEEYDLTPKKFAAEVNKYIQTKDKDFRFVFLVDEIGQFIAEDVNKMLNLQTIVESLSESCNGQAWVVVTSQQDIESIMGDVNSQQQHDFARIMGRFKTKLNLTSANADEVIKKRILSKKEEPSAKLRHIYFEQQASLKSLFYFTEGMQFQQIQNEEDFESNYPFIPYQFDLLGVSLLELSRHNAMLGRAQSVGERSMLELFQKTAQIVMGKELGALSDFSNFYKPLQSILKTEVINAINLSESNPVLDDFDRKVLKTLFLVRYIESFKANKENIATLLISKLAEDKLELEKRTQEALNKLENQTFIQRSGEFYFYLTNEEKDIIEEVKSIAIDNFAINDHLANVIYDGTLGLTKITHPDFKQDYKFTRRLDDDIKSSQEHEVGINIITPYYHMQDESALISKSMGVNDLLVKLPDDDILKKEIRLFLQTQKYYKQYASDTSRSESYKRILNEQLQENSTRKNNITKRIEKLLQGAIFIANGRVLDLKGVDSRTKIITAFNESIAEFYPQRKVLREQYKESDITSILNAADDLTSGIENNLTEAEQVIVSKIALAKQQNDILTLKTLIDTYGTFPYGWDRWAVICLVASLWRKARADVKLHGDILEISKLSSELNNTHSYPNLVIIQAYTPPTAAIKIVKEIYNEIFSKPLSSSESKEVYVTFKSALEELVNNIKITYVKQDQYPFVSVLKEPIELFEKVSKLGQSDLFDNISKYQEDLEDMYEDHISKIKKFMNPNNGQVVVYNGIKQFYMQESANIPYIKTGSDIDEINSFIHSQKPYASGLAQKANEAFLRVKSELDSIIAGERDEVVKTADRYIDLFQNNDDFTNYLSPEQKNRVLKPFLDLKNSANNVRIIDSLKNSINSMATTYTTQSDMAEEFIYEAKVDKGEIEVEKPKPTVSFSLLHRKFSGEFLENSDDVEKYINNLKDELLQTISEDKKISL